MTLSYLWVWRGKHTIKMEKDKLNLSVQLKLMRKTNEHKLTFSIQGKLVKKTIQHQLNPNMQGAFGRKKKEYAYLSWAW